MLNEFFTVDILESEGYYQNLPSIFAQGIAIRPVIPHLSSTLCIIFKITPDYFPHQIACQQTFSRASDINSSTPVHPSNFSLLAASSSQYTRARLKDGVANTPLRPPSVLKRELVYGPMEFLRRLESLPLTKIRTSNTSVGVPSRMIAAFSALRYECFKFNLEECPRLSLRYPGRYIEPTGDAAPKERVIPKKGINRDAGKAGWKEVFN